MRRLSQGVIYVAYGEKAINACRISISALRKTYSGPISVVSDTPIANSIQRVTWISFPDVDPGARWPKLHVDVLSPYTHTLYLDADTIPYGSVLPGFAPIEAGWDLIITPSTQQGEDFLWKCSSAERTETIDSFGSACPLSLQGGVFWFGNSPRLHAFFATWREEWKKYRDQDQGALLRALQKSPIKIWLFGRPWNGGRLIGHRFGSARRRDA